MQLQAEEVEAARRQNAQNAGHYILELPAGEYEENNSEEMKNIEENESGGSAEHNNEENENNSENENENNSENEQVRIGCTEEEINVSLNINIIK